jgi:sialic acid synthase SpsE
VRHVREVEAALRRADDSELAAELARSRAWAEQSIVAARDLAAGSTVSFEDVAFKRPGHGGLPPAELDSVLGRTLRRAVAADEQIVLDDVD